MGIEKLPKLMKGSQGKRLQEEARNNKANNQFQGHRESNAEPTSKPFEDETVLSNRKTTQGFVDEVPFSPKPNQLKSVQIASITHYPDRIKEQKTRNEEVNYFSI